MGTRELGGLFVAALLFGGALGCDGQLASRREDGGSTRDGGALDTGTPLDARTPDDGGTTPTDAGDDAAAPPVDAFSSGTDDALVTNAPLPRGFGCTAATTTTITMQNTGTTTWSGDLGYALVAVDAADPLAHGVTRAALAPGEAVAPGETHDFAVRLDATGVPAGAHDTAWRMSAGTPFGATASSTIQVYACETITPADFDLASVQIVGSPDVRGFARTSTITALSFQPDTWHIDHTARGTWPPIVIAPDGTTQEATVWVILRIGGTWYATGGERLRPAQADKSLSQPSQLGPDWLYDPGRWGVMAGYVPSPGDLTGFMVVAGSTRSDDNVMVMERTGVVLVPFPADGVTTSYPPFAWAE